MTDLYDKTYFHDYAIQVPHLMIEAQKGQIQECHVREELGLEQKSLNSQNSPLFTTTWHLIFLNFVLIILQMSQIKQNKSS